VAGDALGDRLQALGMLASALAGRPVAVAELPPGEPSWTDGQTIFVEGSAKLEAIAVHASMLAAGSLDPDVVRPLVRHPRLARRFLAIEGHRALIANSELLPGVLASMGDRGIAGRSDSPADSLSIAAGRTVIDDPAPEFGVIRAAKVLAATSQPGKDQDQESPGHGPRGGGTKELEEFDDDEIDDSDDPDMSLDPNSMSELKKTQRLRSRFFVLQFMQMRPRQFHNRIKRRRIGNRQFAQHLAIQFNPRRDGCGKRRNVATDHRCDPGRVSEGCTRADTGREFGNDEQSDFRRMGSRSWTCLRLLRNDCRWYGRIGRVRWPECHSHAHDE